MMTNSTQELHKQEQKQGQKPVVLALDTSTSWLTAALTEGDQVLGEVLSQAERNHSIYLVPELKKLLEAHQVNSDRLSCIAVGQGPGSYTGTRIAITAAKTLAWIWNKPLVAVSSLEVLAYGAWQQYKETGKSSSVWVVPMLDARRTQVYTAAFATGSGSVDKGWKRIAEDGIRLMASWADELIQRVQEAAETTPSILVLAGELAPHEAEVKRLEASLAEQNITVIRIADAAVAGRYVAELGIEKWTSGELVDTHSLIPNYTQLTEAEVQLKQREQAGER